MSLNRKISKARNKRVSRDMAFDAIVARGIQIARDSGLDVELGEMASVYLQWMQKTRRKPEK